MDSWRRAVDRVRRGEWQPGDVRLGTTPALLRPLGLGPFDMVMSAGKIARARREHPQLALALWYDLPALLISPSAAFASPRDDGTLVVCLAVVDAEGCPVIAPVVRDDQRRRNVVLTVYGKQPSERSTGFEWIAAQLGRAHREGRPYFREEGFAGTEPKPEPAETASSPSAPIAAGGPAKPSRPILSISSKIKKRGDGDHE